jgi:hypothetical protein
MILVGTAGATRGVPDDNLNASISKFLRPKAVVEPGIAAFAAALSFGLQLTRHMPGFVPEQFNTASIAALHDSVALEAIPRPRIVDV